MNNKRNRNTDRRQGWVSPWIPFQDSNGVVIMECRRKIPDRRIANIYAEWLCGIERDKAMGREC